MKENLLPKLKHALKNESDLNKLPATYLFMTPTAKEGTHFNRTDNVDFYKDRKYYLHKFYKPISQLEF
jgi:hypothetical protein